LILEKQRPKVYTLVMEVVNMELAERIEMNPERLNGKPVIRGTRITVELILKKMAEGAEITDLLESYPHLEKADIQAVLNYAAQTHADEEFVRPTGT
jgi:uncharacterized protein (DUF433 family)